MDTIYTSQLSDLSLSSSLDSLRVTVKANGRSLLDELYYSYGGVLPLPDIQYVVEQFMRVEGLSVAAVSIGSEDDPAFGYEATVVYMPNLPAQAVDARELMESSFLTSHSVAMLPASISYLPVPLNLAFVAVEPVNSVTRSYQVRDLEGNVLSRGLTSTVYAQSGLDGFKPSAARLTVNVWQDLKAIEASAGVPEGSYSLVALKVKAGERVMTYYVDPLLDHGVEFFTFRNSFNALESVALPGSLKEKVESDRSIALLTHRLASYNRQTDRSYEFTTGLIPFESIEAVTALVDSHSVFHVARPACVDVEVVVTEAKIEFAEAEGLPSLSFGFRVAGLSRSGSLVAPPVALIPDNSIFTDHYSEEFS